MMTKYEGWKWLQLEKEGKKKRKLEDSKLFRKSLCQVSSYYSYTVSLDFAHFNLCPKQKERNLIDSDLY